ncbi:MAG: lysophospholipid acyltransferase family protein [Gammaproteobacteria bacterium]|nr:lysophospholipid acyltransferase family protein [Gammaproteobacteria bacterium]
MSATPAIPARSTALSVKSYLPPHLSARPALVRMIDAALGLSRLAAGYERLPAAQDPRAFAELALAALGVSVAAAPAELARVPGMGPCLVVANHPHGGLDGLALVSLLLQVRRDVKILANHFLAGFSELRPLFLEVNPFGGDDAARRNPHAVRAAHRWLGDGGLVLMFPGGEVSSLDLATREVIDPPWQHGAARLVRKSGASVVPVHLDGRNSALFQLGGLVHAKLRTALLVREMLKPKRERLGVRVGQPIAAADLATLGCDAAVTDYLRCRTYLLREAGRAATAPTRQPRLAPLAAPVDPGTLAADVAALPGSQRLIESGKFSVWYANAAGLPAVLPELGRLRELSFRAVGEGTGRAVDLDEYDAHYTHLFVWDASVSAVVGGYRLGDANAILATHGARGLYVQSLFRLSARLQHELRSGLELGRSFVRPEYQKSFSPLLLLWKGIAAYVVRHPRYRYLFGPVSISNDYHPASQRLLVQFLARHHYAHEHAGEVKPRNPPKRRRREEAALATIGDPDSPLLAGLLQTIENDGKGVPVLLRQYLKLGGKILGFNVDPAFSHVVDCLLLVDLPATRREVLVKYMGRDGAAEYLAACGRGAAA